MVKSHWLTPGPELAPGPGPAQQETMGSWSLCNVKRSALQPIFSGPSSGVPETDSVNRPIIVHKNSRPSSCHCNGKTQFFKITTVSELRDLRLFIEGDSDGTAERIWIPR